MLTIIDRIYYNKRCSLTCLQCNLVKIEIDKWKLIHIINKIHISIQFAEYQIINANIDVAYYMFIIIPSGIITYNFVNSEAIKICKIVIYRKPLSSSSVT